MVVKGTPMPINDARASRARESQLQAVLDHAPDAFVSMARDGRIIEWNLQAERMFGWSRAEALGRTVADLIVPPQARRDHEHGLAQYLATGEARVLNRPIEVQAQTKDGALLPVELTIAAVGDGNGETFNAFLRDISERRTHELALREAEAMFRGAFTDASVGMCLATLEDGCWSQVNPALCALLGYSADQLIGLGFDQVTHPDDRAAELEGARRLRDGEIDSYETAKRYLHAAGHVIWVSVSVSLLRDGDGVARCFIAQVLDVTARKTSDAALATSEERFRLMVESVEDYAILMLDLDGRVATWNAGAQRLQGYRAEEIIGRHLSVFYAPEDVAAGKPERELQIAAATGRLEDEGWRVTKDGTRFWANVRITALRDAHGTLRCYGEVIRDLTELHAAEQARRAARVLFETAFADAPIGMALVGLDGSWLKVNRALCQIVGWSEAELLARTFQDITHPDDLDADLAHVAALVRGDSDSYQMDKRYLHRDGRVIWIKLSARLVRDPSGAPAHLIAQMQDITASRDAQRALARSEARLQALFEHIPAGMALRDIDGRYEHVNAYVARSLGLEPEQMVGRSAEDLFPDLADAVRSQDARLLASGGPLAEEMSVPLGHGSPGDFHVVRYPVRDADGTVTGLGSFSVEITERKRAERELDKQRGALAEAQAIAQTGSWSWDPETDVAEWSDEMYRIFGRDPDAGPATAGDLFAYLHPDDRDRIAAGYAQAFGAGESFELDYRVVAGGGEQRSLHGLGRREAGGRYVGTVQDVTERKLIEASLRDAEELLALAFDHSPLGMTLSTPDRGLVRLNQAFADMLGYTVQELMAHPHPTHYTHPDDHAVDREHIRALLDGDKPHTQWDKRYIHAAGHSVWARISLSVLHHPDGSPRHLISQIEDISERRQHEAEERALRDVAELVAAAAEREDVFSAIAEQVRELFDAHASAVVRFDRLANTGVMLGASASDGADLVGTTFDLDSATATAEVFRSGHPARVDALSLSAGDPMSPTIRRFGLTGSVAAPIHVGGRLWGAVAAAVAEQHLAADAELRLERFAHLASLAITNMRTLESLEHRAATDPLTGIANHRTFHDRLRSEVERAKRYGRDLSVVLLDLDHFKAINDTHGHQTGDRILTQVAQRLAGEARDGELVARIGGEEFAWLIPEANRHAAYAAAERVRRAIQSTPLADIRTVTLSAGVCSTEHARDAQQLMLNADRALYRAKEHGRNHTSVYSDDAHAVVEPPGRSRSATPTAPPD
jgi:diguanylate cyclase (GGDEF)-like protein/PAS domain S-box-containing protein